MTVTLEHIDEEQIEPFKRTAGFYAFLAALLLPMLTALAVFAGAWAVSDEVYAAEERFQTPARAENRLDGDVAGWKKTLVGVCPVH
jgi:hypothetical protein